MKNSRISYEDFFPVFYDRPGKPKWEDSKTIEEIADLMGMEIPKNKAEKQYLLNLLRSNLYNFRDIIAEDSNHFLISMKIEGFRKVYLITREPEKIEMYIQFYQKKKRNIEYTIKELKDFDQGLLFASPKVKEVK